MVSHETWIWLGALYGVGFTVLLFLYLHPKETPYYSAHRPCNRKATGYWYDPACPAMRAFALTHAFPFPAGTIIPGKIGEDFDFTYELSPQSDAMSVGLPLEYIDFVARSHGIIVTYPEWLAARNASAQSQPKDDE